MKDKLISEEWDFSPDRVSKDELIPCLLYEYARESPTICELSQRVAQCAPGEEPDNFDAEIWQELRKIKTVSPYNGYGLQSIIRQGDFPDYTRPWQILTREQKDTFNLWTVKRHRFLRPTAHVVREIQASIDKQKAEINAANDREDQKMRAKYGPYRKDWPKREMLYAKPSAIIHTGAETTVILIDWAAFTNRQIRDAAWLWIKHNRPPDTPEPTARGKQKAHDIRASLNALGIVRVCRRYTLCETKFKLPDFWKQRVHRFVFESKNALCWSWAEKEMNQKRHLASRTFLRLLQFETRVPPSWKTAGASRRTTK